ncbi:MAG: hypothetical protein GY822_10000 [Deltaproteobacteria bacterium]|nr:hypothetical protein [Deltaproteobacteria bacterium]
MSNPLSASRVVACFALLTWVTSACDDVVDGDFDGGVEAKLSNPKHCQSKSTLETL